MDCIAWDHTLETGHARMDAEHKALADLFNLLPRAANAGKGRDYCASVLEEVIERTKMHFDLERQLMVQYRYPQIDQHAAEHTMLIDQALLFRATFEIDADGSRLALARFAEVWLVFHILFSDKQLAQFLAPGA